MTDDELNRIEAALGILLPAAYRKLVGPFPVPAYAGNFETELWDDSNRLVELNQELRKGSTSVHPWPVLMFAMGRDEGGCASAIDLKDPTHPVWWADRCHLDVAGSGPVSPSIEEWGFQYVADLRSDLEGNGIDPDGSPEARQQALEAAARSGCRCMLVLLIAAAALAAIAGGLIAWLKS